MNALFVTFFAGLSVIIGAAAARLAKKPGKVEHISIALATGALLSLMIFDLFPDIAEAARVRELKAWVIALCAAAGFGILKLLDLFIPDHRDTGENHDRENSAHIGIISSLAIILHNILEGMTIFSLSSEKLSQGLIFGIGVALHNIPMGMLIYSTVMHRSRKTKTAMMSVVALSTLVGGALMMCLKSYLTSTLRASLVCVALGMIVYIVFAELLPHLIKTKPVYRSLLVALLGFGIVAASCLLIE